MKHEKAIAYYRVSTARQGQSGLGLEAQRAAVAAFCKGRELRIVGEYQDVESGKHDDRPELSKALAAAKVAKATLVIAKLDRLSRDNLFILTLRKAGVDFIAADVPEVNTLTIGVMAAMTQYDRENISARIKAAIAARKARGLAWDQGKGNLAKAKAWEKSIASKKRAAREHANGAMTHAVNYREAGWLLQDIADALNKAGARTRHGHPYTPTTVSRLLKMAQEGT